MAWWSRWTPRLATAWQPAIFLTLADMSQPMLEISLDESDYNAVQAGYRVHVVFDAYPDTTLSGEVVQVYPSLYCCQR